MPDTVRVGRVRQTLSLISFWLGGFTNSLISIFLSWHRSPAAVMLCFVASMAASAESFDVSNHISIHPLVTDMSHVVLVWCPVWHVITDIDSALHTAMVIALQAVISQLF